MVLVLLENSLIYPAPKYPIGYWEDRPAAVEEVTFQAADGTSLHGWFVPHLQPRGTLLYFHGNGENISYLGPLLDRFNQDFDLQVLAFDYRGYGNSSGRPTESGLQQDARAALAWLNNKTQTQPHEVIFFGRSLGGAVAVELASGEGCQALVLECTFASLPEVASWHYPWLPVRWLMRNRFPSSENILNCPQPLLQSHGNADRVIPFASGRRLFDASPNKQKVFLELDGVDHNDPTPAEVWVEFEKMLLGLSEESVQ